jgi:dihydropteroate synthase/2-amino-4-hydroxy-6-hydroxymethyldihydropteridine diphosphokinase
MRCFVGFGSNLGDRSSNLEKAARALANEGAVQLIQRSPLVETPALVPEGAPEHWRKSFLNAVVEIGWDGSPNELVRCLKKIEVDLGREPAPRWAPRSLDLDLLTFGDQTIGSETLQVPHPELFNRQFVLAPLKHLAPSLKIPGHQETVLERSRSLKNPLPLWMGILNFTPDSFSDGNELSCAAKLEDLLEAFDQDNTQIIDLGAESTRPGAIPLTSEEEWGRLAAKLEFIFERFRNRIFRPCISVDTYHPQTAARAAALGVEIINDVSGLTSEGMLEVLKDSNCQYVLMHSLTVPANPNVNLQVDDPVQNIIEWAQRKIDQLDRSGVNLDRVIFDPGIGFGKTGAASVLILQQIQRFFSLPVRILVGHSRKSFLNQWGHREVGNRDSETLGVSLKLAERGVDILRVHRPDLHQRSFRTFREV